MLVQLSQGATPAPSSCNNIFSDRSCSAQFEIRLIVSSFHSLDTRTSEKARAMNASFTSALTASWNVFRYLLGARNSSFRSSGMERLRIASWSGSSRAVSSAFRFLASSRALVDGSGVEWSPGKVSLVSVDDLLRKSVHCRTDKGNSRSALASQHRMISSRSEKRKSVFNESQNCMRKISPRMICCRASMARCTCSFEKGLPPEIFVLTTGSLCLY